MSEDGKLDEISQAIGRVDAYVHEGRHATNEIKALVKASDAASEKRHGLLRSELSEQLTASAKALKTQLTDIDDRVCELERASTHRQGAVSVWVWLAKNYPLVGMLLGLSGFIAWANGRIG